MDQPRWTRRPEGSNWGDFGPDDQIGRLNIITPAMRRAALQEVQDGLAFVLSLPLDYPGGEAETAPRRGPKLFAAKIAGHQLFNFPITATDVCCDDGVIMYMQYSTQWDSLAHWGRMFDTDGSDVLRPVYYNGFRAAEHVRNPDSEGNSHCGRLGIENMAMTAVQGRAVLVDLARAFGTGRTLIGYDEMMQAMETQQVEIKTGDFLALHTGYGDALMAMQKRPDEAVLHHTGAALNGADKRLLDWIDQSGIVAIVADNPAVEAFDPELKATGESGLLPLHDRCLFKLGIHLGELWWLSDLARHLERVGRSAFLLTAPPLRLPGAVGSPVTPVATV